jgi:hypothetical protein
MKYIFALLFLIALTVADPKKKKAAGQGQAQGQIPGQVAGQAGAQTPGQLGASQTPNNTSGAIIIPAGSTVIPSLGSNNLSIIPPGGSGVGISIAPAGSIPGNIGPQGNLSVGSAQAPPTR